MNIARTMFLDFEAPIDRAFGSVRSQSIVRAAPPPGAHHPRDNRHGALIRALRGENLLSEPRLRVFVNVISGFAVTRNDAAGRERQLNAVCPFPFSAQNKI